MNKGWIELLARGPESCTELVSALLIEAGSPGVALEEKARLVEIKGYIKEPCINDKTTTKALRQKLSALGFSLKLKPYNDTDWREKWKEGLRPVRASLPKGKKRLVVKPTWIKLKKEPGDIIIEIDPGMAFGVGSHPSTKGCLKALLFVSSKKKYGLDSTLDVGTGTGVLGIAAKMLGAKKVVGTDNDHEAIKIARLNAKQNNTELTLTTTPAEKIRGRFNVIVANILSPVLIEMMPTFLKLTETGGVLILSGILTEEAAFVREAAKAKGFSLIKTFCLSGRGYGGGEWKTLVMEKR